MCLNMPFNGVFRSNRELNKLVPRVRRGLGARRLRLATEERGFIPLLFSKVKVTEKGEAPRSESSISKQSGSRDLQPRHGRLIESLIC